MSGTTERVRTRWSSGWFFGLLLLLSAATPSICGGIAIVNTTLTDNGDNDGYADSNETVTLRLTVKNTSDIALAAVTGSRADGAV